MRLVDLADRMLWSTSRTAHHLDRMQRRDLVRREKHPTNSRATVVALTEHGQDVIEKAAPHHLDSVRHHFIDRLTPHEIDVFGDATEAVLNHLRQDTDPPGDRRPEREVVPGAPSGRCSRPTARVLWRRCSRRTRCSTARSPPTPDATTSRIC